MKWTNDNKEKIQYILAVASIVFGLGLTCAGFIVEPTGEVDGTVLGVLGECIGFAGAIFGITLHYNNELDKFKRQVNDRLGKEEGDV